MLKKTGFSCSFFMGSFVEKGRIFGEKNKKKTTGFDRLCEEKMVYF